MPPGTVAEPRWSPDGRRLAWVRSGAEVASSVVDGRPVPGLVAAGTRGGTFTWATPERLVVVGEGGLWAVSASGPGPGSLAAPAAGLAAAPAVGPTGLVAFVDGTDDACVVKVAPLDGSRAPWVVSRADWAWDPAWSPDGALLAWHEWDVPDMPWDGSRIVVAAPDGSDRLVVAGGPTEAVGQPRFAPAGPARLGFVSDRSGFANLTVAAPDGSASVAVVAEACEHAEPSWGPGQRSFAWSPDGARLAWCRNEDGFGRLVVGRVAGGQVGEQAGGSTIEEWSKGWHHWLDWGPPGLVCVRSGARTPPTVVVVAGPSERRAVDVAAEADDWPVDEVVEPRAVTWPAGDGETVHGLLYLPDGHSAPAPLLVSLHGGPTDQHVVGWDPRIQWFVARGWVVLAPNVRGSTGHGRAYARALDGGWGARDVDDTVAGIRAAVARGWADPGRVALLGGSAGAFTALLVAARAPDLVRAVAASYPVTDLFALAAETYRFERHYTDTLVGVLPGAADAYRARSPVSHAAELRAPLLVLQGDADPVVPAAQTRAFVAAVRAAGGRVELHEYPGEGHGLKHPAARADALRRTDEFLTREVLSR